MCFIKIHPIANTSNTVDILLKDYCWLLTGVEGWKFKPSSGLVLPSLTLAYPEAPMASKARDRETSSGQSAMMGTNQAGCITDGMGPPATVTHDMAAHRERCVVALDHPGEKIFTKICQLY